MSSKSLLDILDIRPADNTAKEGNLVEIFRGNEEIRARVEEIRQVTFHVLLPQQVGGNHYHTKRYEILYVARGKVGVYLFDRETGETIAEEIPAGFKFDLVPGVAHATHNPTQELAFLIEFANLAFDPTNPKNDVLPYEVFAL